MADIPTDVGYMHVVATAIEAGADSNDAGDLPDAWPFEAIVTIAAKGLPAGRPFLVAVADDTIIYPRPITCRMTGGQLVPPDDGSDGTFDVTPLGAPRLTIVAPNQGAIDYVNWGWEATFKPLPDTPVGAKWRQFVVNFTGAPGETVSLARAAFVASAIGASQVPIAWFVTTAELPDVADWATVLPNARAGQFIFFTDTDDLYLIGA